MVNANCHMSQNFVPKVDTEIPSVGHKKKVANRLQQPSPNHLNPQSKITKDLQKVLGLILARMMLQLNVTNKVRDSGVSQN